MKNIKKISVFLLSSFAFSTPSFANNAYILGQLGAINQKDWKDFGLTGRVALGYEWDTALILGKCVTEPSYLYFNYGLELGYQAYEKGTQSRIAEGRYSKETSTIGLQRQTFDLLAVIDILPNPCLDIFVKFGPGVIMQKRDSEFSADLSKIGVPTVYRSSKRTRDSRIVPKLIAGVGYNVTEAINVNLAFTEEFDTSTVRSLSSITAGVKYKFC